MPPSHSFWAILIGKTPTSFRGKTREDLLPTLRQLQRTQTDVTLRWIEKGKVWESPEAAIGAAKLAATEARERRGKDWRPGGDHRDPKARFEMTRDQKRAKFKRERSGEDRSTTSRSNSDTGAPESPFGPRPPRVPRPAPDRGSRPPRSDDNPFGARPPRQKSTGGPSSSAPENPFKSRPRRPPAGADGGRGGSRPPKRRS